jgi:hypothetical protein
MKLDGFLGAFASSEIASGRSVRRLLTAAFFSAGFIATVSTGLGITTGPALVATVTVGVIMLL